MGDFESNNGKPQFQPSRLSFTPKEMALGQIRLMRRVLDGLEAQIREPAEVPRWVLDRLSRSSQEVTLIASYVDNEKKRKKA